MRGATTRLRSSAKLLRQISIHAPHARSDKDMVGAFHRTNLDFNPRSSCEERHSSSKLMVIKAYISIHAPHARSDLREHRPFPVPACISIHAPHARSDVTLAVIVSQMDVFQSTLLMRGATSSAVHLRTARHLRAARLSMTLARSLLA